MGEGRHEGWNFADVWEAIADAQPDVVALMQRDRSVTWKDFDRRAGGLASALYEAGLRRGDKVAQYLLNCPEYMESVFACFKGGFTPVNTNYRYVDDELIYLWDNADAAAVVFQGSLTPVVARVRARLAGVAIWIWVDDGSEPCPPWAMPFDDAAALATDGFAAPEGRSGNDVVFIYTGGTTGKPKGTMWRQDDLFHALNDPGGVWIPEDADPKLIVDRRRAHAVSLPAAPLMHGFGLNNSITALTTGGAVVLTDRGGFDPENILDLVDKRHVSSLCIVGDAMSRPLLSAIEMHPGRWDFGSLKIIISAGAPWSTDVKERLVRHCPRTRLMDLLSSSEAIGTASAQSAGEEIADSARFRPGPHTKVLTEAGREVMPGSGEVGLLAHGGRLPIGYYKDEAKSAQTFVIHNGRRWSVVGDLATVESDGSILLLGRNSLVINTGGEKVHPEEVETVLRAHPLVRDAVVVGIPHPRFGSAIVARVELEESSELDSDELRDYARTQLASYKVPRHVQFIPTVDRGANGKIDYARHAALAQETLCTD